MAEGCLLRQGCPACYCPAGKINKIRLLGDMAHSTRIAFIEFIQAESAMAALNCSGALLGSLPLRVSPSKTPVRSDKEDKEARRQQAASARSETSTADNDQEPSESAAVSDQQGSDAAGNEDDLGSDGEAESKQPPVIDSAEQQNGVTDINQNLSAVVQSAAAAGDAVGDFAAVHGAANGVDDTFAAAEEIEEPVSAAVNRIEEPEPALQQ